MSIIKLSNIGFSYGDQPILEKINLTVSRGDYLGIIGPNGSGKTTLLKIILGLLKPTHGQLLIDGQPSIKIKQFGRIGYVPQRVSQADFQFPATVFEVIESGLSKSDAGAVAEVIKLLKLDGLQHRLIGQLSGGQRQRVFIARALVSRPEILILDEPTVGVDVASMALFYTLLCDLNSNRKLTIILVSHDIDVVAKEVKTVLFLNKTVVANGPVKDILQGKNLEKLYGEQVKFITHQHKD